jgi:cysteine desulfurase/selenocysteine lyase
LIDGLKGISSVNVIGPLEMQDRGGVVSFTIDGVHPHDVGQVLDQYGIAVRTGHHCAWPLMKKLNLVGTTRASFHVYNDEQDVMDLINAVKKVKEYFKVGV